MTRKLFKTRRMGTWGHRWCNYHQLTSPTSSSGTFPAVSINPKEAPGGPRHSLQFPFSKSELRTRGEELAVRDAHSVTQLHYCPEPCPWFGWTNIGHQNPVMEPGQRSCQMFSMGLPLPLRTTIKSANLPSPLPPWCAVLEVSPAKRDFFIATVPSFPYF